MELRKATPDDITKILEITGSARDYQRSLGFVQWEDGYPGRDVISNDIARGDGYVAIEDGLPAAYAVLAIGDKDYDLLTDAWHFDGPYGVIHRLAIAPEMRGRHLSENIFREIEKEYLAKGIGIIRIDTGRGNLIMRHLMEKLNYQPRGEKHFSWGPRLAYEKKL